VPSWGLTYGVVLQSALSVGLDDVGLVSAQRWDSDALFMDQWVAHGFHGNMSYLERNSDKRYDIRELVPGARTVIVALLTYEHSGHDYHRTMKSRLYELKQRLTDLLQPTGTPADSMFSTDHQHIFCDSAPILERRMAVAARLGFIGRNHQLIHPQLGSRVHIGELVLQKDVPDEQRELPENGCGDCRKCIEACPGQALGRDEWDARRCVAYVTHKCEICQQVCPYNEKLK